MKMNRTTEHFQGAGTRRRWRQRFGLILLFCFVLLLPSTSFAVNAAADDPVTTVANPGTELWRSLRHETNGVTQARGPEAHVLINNAGQQWREFRTGTIVTSGAWVIGAICAMIFTYHFAFKGGVKLEKGRSGRTVFRWSLFDRVLHWFVASLFLILAVTGFSLLYGRTFIIPVIGQESFSALIQIGKVLHNYLGPPFVIGVLLIALLWFKRNLPDKTDLQWLKVGGGFFSNAHPHCGHFNLGEKVMTYGLLATVGIVTCLSGLILDFPIFSQTREMLQLSHVVHTIAALIWLAFILGHIYLGSNGVEGALDGMVHGRVDENWAKQHHDLWYEEVSKRDT